MNDFVLIEWLDSCKEHGWLSPPDGNGLSEIRSIGHIVKETDDSIVITTSISEWGRILDPVGIPKVAIRKIRRIKASKLGWKG